MGSPMKSTSAGSSCSGKCPKCHVGSLVRIQSHQPNTYGKWFVKCSENIWGDPTTCGYIRPDVQNVKSEAQEHGLEAEPSARGCCSEMKDEVKLLNQRIDSVVTEVWNLKVAFVGCVGVVIGVLVAYMLLK
ncbi:hypothetical protein BDA96_02G119900 [Sorghum bicolor]|uniref:Uncharacterized protein n=2 Tax=Sorghum bicolor TaxID=4558 RepID=A0A921RNA6_SORBI|nr:uncharacterized protein LOC110432871 [Sorghum bicolor]KAG0381268.1 hypothetical protein BDA96_K002400 [Sorghum bicolor]KAG0522856.1 hypothetical protein BDA96_07G073600 [Sorghum bicolor]KAG0542616.1 hypothetical protein BDA96_02G119900 [Sorghum bicolor]KXG34957.1 hypothetical protein SORBI_3002G114100 [Sorghum bicolor]|eukprot:XP_021309579.1 uncharacterized protein LOC110432871 [Sorghum bicolor]